MNMQRLSTGEAMAAGIFNLPTPETSHPEDLCYQTVREDDWFDDEHEEPEEGEVRCDAETLKSILLAGQGLHASQYYGVWWIWPGPDGHDRPGFHGELCQYRSVTETFHTLSVEEAIQKALYWLAACAG